MHFSESNSYHCRKLHHHFDLYRSHNVFHSIELSPQKYASIKDLLLVCSMEAALGLKALVLHQHHVTWKLPLGGIQVDHHLIYKKKNYIYKMQFSFEIHDISNNCLIFLLNANCVYRIVNKIFLDTDYFCFICQL